MSLAKALLEVQKELPAIEPDAVNPHFKNKYVSLDRLLAVCLPILNKHGVVLSQNPCHIDGHPALITEFLHAESDERIGFVAPLILEKDNSQGMGSAITYMRRYALAAALGVSGEKDDDGNAASHAKKPKAASKPAVPRGEKLQARINELAAAADTLREAEPDTTHAELEKVAKWRSGGLSCGKLNEADLEWLGGELADYVAAGAKGSFYDSATLAF